MLLNQEEFFKKANQERLTIKEYEVSCARVYGIEYEVPALGVRLSCNIVAFSQEQAERLLYKQVPKEWIQKGINITAHEAKARVDLIASDCFEIYNKRLVAAKK